MEAVSKKKGNNFLVQGSILAIASIISRLIGIIYRIPLTNILGDEGIGIYSLAYEVYNICLILSCYSIPTAVSKLVAAKMEMKEHKSAYQIFRNALILSMIVGFFFTLILLFGADFFADTLFKNKRAAIPIRVLAPNLFIFSIMGVFRGFYQGKNTMIPTSISQILEQFVNAIVSVVAAYSFMNAHNLSDNISAYGAAGGTLGTVMGSLAGLMFLLFIYIIYRPTLRRQIRKDVYSEEQSSSEVYKLLMVTIFPIILSQTVYQVSGIIDSSVYHRILESKGVSYETRDALLGIYLGKYKVLTNVPIAIATAIGAAMLPSIVGAMTRGSIKEVKRKIHASIKFNMIIAIPCSIGMAVLAKPIIQLLFRSSTAESTNTAAALLQVGCFAIVFVALSTISNSILQGIGKLKVPVYHSAIALVIHIVVLVICLQFTKTGLFALVISYMVFALIVCALNWIYIARELHYKQEIIRTFVIPFLSSTIMGAIAYITYHFVHFVVHSNLISIVISVGIAIIIYFVMLIGLHGLSEDELLHIPGGRYVVKVAKKIHLM